jgi:hypothetical protein
MLRRIAVAVGRRVADQLGEHRDLRVGGFHT